MFGFGNSPQEALAASLLAMVLVGIIASGLMRWRRLMRPTDLLMPAALLAAYWLVYNKVPAFPPVGAVNKVFYVIVIGTAVGFAVEIAARRAVRVVSLFQPVAAAFYIGLPRLGVATWEVAAAATAGVAIVWLVLGGASVRAEDDVKRGGVVAVLALGFAPIALLGASSSSFQLCLMLVAGCLGILLIHIINPVFRFGGASATGALGGLISVAYTVVLITRKADPIAIAILGLCVVLPVFSEGICRLLGISRQFPRLFVHIALAALPAALAVVVAFLDYGSSFPV
ncbi:hypothetical protein FHT72_007133 [Rhizobium sp. BK077]|uniref:hypothetical protein n=1 Tax=unclassified Rhizobium TaxID=2613769 RepID=UPI001615FE7C|nr:MULTISPECIES: hypothetical protein [unclassified Rhizobium]MBB3303479.1 hypothetical protein [Rhizobium sp. BK112]MBB3372586.1 hypothetical protein [Rhizobium sp. BK077]MBB4183369.1 hypothetical protein [Rhizobium sp. BK109]